MSIRTVWEITKNRGLVASMAAASRPCRGPNIARPSAQVATTVAIPASAGASRADASVMPKAW